MVLSEDHRASLEASQEPVQLVWKITPASPVSHEPVCETAEFFAHCQLSPRGVMTTCCIAISPGFCERLKNFTDYSLA